MVESSQRRDLGLDEHQVNQIGWRDYLSLPLNGNRWIKPNQAMFSEDGHTELLQRVVGGNKGGTAKKYLLSVTFDEGYIFEWIKYHLAGCMLQDIADLINRSL